MYGIGQGRGAAEDKGLEKSPFEAQNVHFSARPKRRGAFSLQRGQRAKNKRRFFEFSHPIIRFCCTLSDPQSPDLCSPKLWNMMLAVSHVWLHTAPMSWTRAASRFRRCDFDPGTKATTIMVLGHHVVWGGKKTSIISTGGERW